MKNITESSLSRVWKHFNDKDTTVVIFTAFRDGVPRKESVQKNRAFAAKLKNAGFGYFFVDGYFPENEGTEDEVQVSEDSIFAIADRDTSTKLINLCHKLANEENQDSIIVKELDKGIYFLDKDGNKDSEYLSKQKVTFKEVGKFYTKLRNKKASNLFVFEGTHQRPGFIRSFREYLKEKSLNESSLSRVWKQTQKHDSGTITAFRDAKDCNNGELYTKEEKQKQNAILRAKLLKKGYGVTKVKGTYIENYNTPSAKEVKEDSYLVVDIEDSGNLKKDLIKLGTEFEQDSITYQNKETGEYVLISTNKCPEGYPGSGKIGVEVKLGKSLFGKDGEFHSKVNGRPFVFESVESDIHKFSDFGPTHIRSILELAKGE